MPFDKSKPYNSIQLGFFVLRPFSPFILFIWYTCARTRSYIFINVCYAASKKPAPPITSTTYYLHPFHSAETAPLFRACTMHQLGTISIWPENYYQNIFHQTLLWKLVRSSFRKCFRLLPIPLNDWVYIYIRQIEHRQPGTCRRCIISLLANTDM